MDTEELKKQFETDLFIYDYIFPYREYQAWGKNHQLDFCVLTDKKNPDKKVIRFQKRFFGVSKKMTENGETKPRWIIYKTFNLNPEKDFLSFYAIVQKFKEGKIQEVNDVLQSIDLESHNNHITKLTKSLAHNVKKKRRSKEDDIELTRTQEETARLLDRIDVLSDNNRKLRFQNFKSNITHYRKILKGIKSNLEKQPDNEPYFQQQFSDNKWIFGPWYENVLPKKMADTSNQPDFVLKRFDGFADIVEIEAPGKPLFRAPNKSDKTQPHSQLTQALYQVMNYIDSYNENYATQFYKDYAKNATNPLNPYKPRGLVIIGRDKVSERQRLRQFNSFLNNVMIITYDEFLHNSESIIELIAHLKV